MKLEVGVRPFTVNGRVVRPYQYKACEHEEEFVVSISNEGIAIDLLVGNQTRRTEFVWLEWCSKCGTLIGEQR